MYIEMHPAAVYDVALLTEGVDRNCTYGFFVDVLCHVALLTEGVDRNIYVLTLNFSTFRRPPHGGRG